MLATAQKHTSDSRTRTGWRNPNPNKSPLPKPRSPAIPLPYDKPANVKLACVFGLLAATGTAARSLAATNTGADAILILDGSGSMWGEVDGRTKIEAAREAVAEVIKALPEDTRLGLMSYGHRRKGDCSDIELILSPALLNTTGKANFLAKVDAIQPKGKTPLQKPFVWQPAS